MPLHETLEDSPFKVLSRSAPLLIFRGFVIASLQFFAKRAIFARAGESELDAYAVYSAIEGLIFLMVFRGFRIISANAAHVYAKELKSQNLAEIELGENTFNPLEMGVLYRQGILFGCILMIPAALLCIFASTIFRLAAQPESVLKNCSSYFLYGFFGYFFDMLYRSRARIDIGRSQPMSALLGDTCESAIDVLLTYPLAIGAWGFPKMGVVGGSVAYAVATAITAIGYNLRSYCHPDLKKYQLYHFTKKEFKNAFLSPEFKKFVLGGLHIASKFSIVYITLMLTTFFCGISGGGALAGLQAAGAYGYLVSLPIGGFSEAASVVMGRLVKKNWEEAKKIGNFTILSSFLFACICAGLLLTLINPIARLFMSDDAAHHSAFQTVKAFLCTQAAMEIINSIGNSGASVLSGCLETQHPFLLTLSFILALNSLLTVATFFIFNHNAPILYGVQLVGLLLTSAGVLMKWKQQENKPDVVSYPGISLWQKPQTESPRHAAVNEFLPVFSKTA